MRHRYCEHTSTSQVVMSEGILEKRLIYLACEYAGEALYPMHASTQACARPPAVHTPSAARQGERTPPSPPAKPACAVLYGSVLQHRQSATANHYRCVCARYCTQTCAKYAHKHDHTSTCACTLLIFRRRCFFGFVVLILPSSAMTPSRWLLIAF